jgi:hypothetical protein
VKHHALEVPIRRLKVDIEKSRVYLGSMASWGNLQRDAARQWLIAGTQSRAQSLDLSQDETFAAIIF